MKLKVPYIKQFNRSSCVAACFEMVLAYYRVKISQRKVYEQSKPTTAGIPYGDLMLAIKDKNYKLERWTNHESWNNKTGMTKAKKLGLIRLHKNAKVNLLKSFLKKGIPVIIGVDSGIWYKSWKAHTGEGHAVVVVGYKTNRFIVNDPFLPYLKKKGKPIEVNSNHLKAAWNLCDNSMSVLTKK